MLDEGDGEDEPGVLGDDVGDEEVDFGWPAGDDAVIGAAMSLSPGGLRYRISLRHELSL